MYGIFTYIYHKNQPNVGNYTVPYMDGMGNVKGASMYDFYIIFPAKGTQGFSRQKWIAKKHDLGIIFVFSHSKCEILSGRYTIHIWTGPTPDPGCNN